MYWFFAAFALLCVALGIRRWRATRPPLDDRIKRAMDDEFSSRVKKRRSDLPSKAEFDFLFEVLSLEKVEPLLIALSTMNYRGRLIESKSDGSFFVEASVDASPADIDFAAFRKQMAPLCDPTVAYLGLGKRSYRAAGINMPSAMEAQGEPSSAQA